MFITEVWRNKKLQVMLDGLPDCLEFDGNPELRAWYAELSKSKKWKTFCETFDEKIHRSGCMSFNGRIIRVYKKEQ